MEKLSPALERFVLHWGEMGTRWGVNRSVAQIHALLFLSDDPLDAETIGDMLGIARSNVSNGLKELLSWRLIERIHLKGDRRDHFVAEKDLLAVMRRIADGRKQREIDPTLTALRDCAMQAHDDPATPPTAAAQMQATLTFLETLDGLYGQFARLPDPVLRQVLKGGSYLQRILPQAESRHD